MTEPTDNPGMDDDQALAGELALRVLSPEEETAARAREASDPTFAAEVDVWNDRLAGIADQVPAVEPSPYVWPRVEAALPPPVAAVSNPRRQRLSANSMRAWLSAALVTARPATRIPSAMSRQVNIGV